MDFLIASELVDFEISGNYLSCKFTQFALLRKFTHFVFFNQVSGRFFRNAVHFCQRNLVNVLIKGCRVLNFDIQLIPEIAGMKHRCRNTSHNQHNDDYGNQKANVYFAPFLVNDSGVQ